MSRDKILELCCYLNENLSKDFIWVSHFQTIISVLFIKKFEEELHFCMNYQDLNAITVKNQYSLSLISETLNHLSWAKIFIKLNIISAFNQLRIKEEDETLIVFCTRFELFKYLVTIEHHLRLNEYILYVFEQTQWSLMIFRAKICFESRFEMSSTFSI